jgi:cell division protease FtsH
MEMVTRYGMNETVGQRTYAPTPPQPLLAGAVPERIDASDATECEIDVAVRDLVAKAYGRRPTSCARAVPIWTKAPACCRCTRP